MKRRSKILLVLVAVLVVGLAFLLPNGDYRRQVEAYKRQLLAQGEKLTMIELAPSHSTNVSNAAVAFTNAMNNYSPTINDPSAMKWPAPGVATAGYMNLSPSEMAGYRSNQVRTAELRAILAGAQTLDFNLDYSLGSEVPLLHLAKIKTAGTLLSATATQALHEGNNSEAWADLLAAVDMVRLYHNEPLMISELVRIATARIAINATWEVLQTNQWTEDQLAELQAKWNDVELLKSSEAVIAMERAFGIDAIAKARKKDNPEEAFPLAGLTSTPSEEGGFPRRILEKAKELYERYPGFWMWKSSWSYDEELYYLRITGEAEKTSRRIAESGAVIPAIVEFNSHITNIALLHPGREKHFRMEFFPDDELFRRWLTKMADSEVIRQMLVTVIALKRYELQHHSYPGSLADLVPNYLRTIPPDLMSGEPLHYRLRPDGNFLLYSVGEDGKDNDGDPTPVETWGSKDWTRARDIVWPRAATAAEVENLKQGEAKKQPAEDK